MHIWLQSPNGVQVKVKQGFSWTGLFFGWLVYMYHGMWFAGIGLVVVEIGLVLGLGLGGLLLDVVISIVLACLINRHIKGHYMSKGFVPVNPLPNQDANRRESA